MAPSTDQTLHDIYGKDGAVSVVLILVNAVIASALLLGACAFCKIFKTKKVNFMSTRKDRPSSELTEVYLTPLSGIYRRSQSIKTKQTEDKTRETIETQNGAIATGTGGESEEKGEGSKMSPRLKNGMVHGSVKSEPDTTPPNLLNRVLPPPPENLQAAPPASEEQDPLYDTVKDIEEVETRQDSVRSDKEGTTNISRNPQENQGSQKVERRNPLYVSADEVPHPPSFQETTSPLEANEKTQVVDEPLYAVIHKEPTVKKKAPAQDPAGDKSTGLQNDNCDDQREVIISMDQKTPDPSNIVDSILHKWRKRSMKTAQLKKQDTTVDIGQDVPPLIPERQFDLESEF